MSFASSSSSASLVFRSAIKGQRKSLASVNFQNVPTSSRRAAQISRNYATDQATVSRDSSSSVLDDVTEASSSTSPKSTSVSTNNDSKRPSTSSRPIDRNGRTSSGGVGGAYRGSSNLTPQKAQEYISNIFHLPPTHQFDPKLSLQLLTHKSYRLNYLPKIPNIQPSLTETEIDLSATSSHNARMSFIGRRAMAGYLTMFLHASLSGKGMSLAGVGLLKQGESLADKLSNLMHVVNVGSTVGKKWEIGKVVRWDGNANTTGAKIHGTAVQALLGGIYSEFGSPAAQRAFHLHMLPHMAWQLRDTMLIDRVETIRADLEKQLGGGIIVLGDENGGQ